MPSKDIDTYCALRLRYIYYYAIVVFSVLSICQLSHAQVPNCWCIPDDTLAYGRLLNPDSVAIDTCGLNYTGSCNDLVTDPAMQNQILYENRYNAKGWFSCDFSVAAFNLPAYAYDAVVEVTWQDIDLAFTSLRASMQALEQQYGTFVLRKRSPANASGPASQRFNLRFDNYVNTAAAQADLRAILEVQHCTFLSTFAISNDVVDDINDRGVISFPNVVGIDQIQGGMPQTDYYEPDFHRLGWHWNLYAMNCPLAWEITKGRKETVIGFRDIVGIPGVPQSDWVINSDIAFRDDVSQAKENNNYIIFNPNTWGNSEILKPSLPLTISQHGVGVVPLAVARADNDNLSLSSPEGGMVGTCFGCSGVGFNNWSTEVTWPDYILYDTDFNAVNGSLRRIAVMSQSQSQGGFKNDVDKVIKAGIIVVAAAGNSRNIGIPEPAGYVYAGATPQEDYQVIAVGGTQDGLKYEGDEDRMQDWMDSDFVANGQYWEGNERIMNHPPSSNIIPQGFETANFSISTDVFSTKTNRIEEKENAFMDLVAPAVDVLTLHKHDADPEDPEDQDPDPNERHQQVRKYRVHNTRTSQSTPQVAGVCGLMVSVNRFLGVPFNETTGLPTGDGAEVQRRAFNILTFTADKLIDVGTDYKYIVDIQNSDNNRHEDVIPTGLVQPDYLSQPNDNLERSWAQRMGFGRVNAYRAVAHSIANKGKYRYIAADVNGFASDFLTTGNGNINEDGKKLMHWGAKIRLGTNAWDIDVARVSGGTAGDVVNVLDWGGVSLPGEIHNNQGVTRIDGGNEEVTFTVPDDAILAIDGILTNDRPDKNNKITTAGANQGKILINGLVENIEILGNTSIGEAIIDAHGGGVGCIFGGGHAGARSNIHDVVTLKNDGLIMVSGGVMKLLPGGEIHMTGAKNIEVKHGGEMIMGHASAIVGDPGRKIIVYNNSKLIIEEGANFVDLLCTVELEDGAEMVIGSNATVTLDHFVIASNATLRINEGSSISLNTGEVNTSAGKLIIEGTAANPARVFGKAGALCKRKRNCTQSDAMASIVANGDLTDANASNVRIKYAEFNNVAVKVVNTSVEPIEYVDFASNRSIFSAPAMLTLHYQEPATPLYVRDVREVEINHCSFIDNDGADNGPRYAHMYEVDGINLGNMIWSQIKNSTFDYLHAGIVSNSCGRVDVENNTADICEYLILDDASAGIVECSNVITSVRNVGTYTGTGYNTVLSNQYDNVHNAITTVSSDRHWLRGNTFGNFTAGIYAAGSDVRLRYRSGIKSERYGYNYFSVPQNGLDNDFIANPNRERWDIGLEADADVALACGYNRMASYSTTHIYSYFPISVEASQNQWNTSTGSYTVRHNSLVTSSGSPLNVTNTAHGCGAQSPPSCTFSGGILCSGDTHPYAGDWESYASTDAYLDNAFTNARVMMLTTSLNPLCRRAKARDGLYAAVLDNSTGTKLATLLTDYTTIELDITTPSILKTAVILLKGEVYERLGDQSSALTEYGKVTTSHSSSVDALLAAWRSQHILAIQADPTFGPGYDALMKAYYDNMRIALDRFKTPVSGATGAKSGVVRHSGERLRAGSAGSAFVLEQNVPNPFGDKTTISFEVSTDEVVRLFVTDVHGAIIATLVDAHVRAGRHSVEFSTVDIASGMYLYRLETSQGAVSRMMAVVK